VKTCVACFRKWEQRGAPDFAEFCDDCFAKVQAGACPAGYQHQTYLAPAGLWAEWPVVVCMDGFRRGSVPFSQAHPQVRRADVMAVLSATEEKVKP
jgi:hypothetical protein